MNTQMGNALPWTPVVWKLKWLVIRATTTIVITEILFFWIVRSKCRHLAASIELYIYICILYIHPMLSASISHTPTGIVDSWVPTIYSMSNWMSYVPNEEKSGASRAKLHQLVAEAPRTKSLDSDLGRAEPDDVWKYTTALKQKNQKMMRYTERNRKNKFWFQESCSIPLWEGDQKISSPIHIIAAGLSQSPPHIGAWCFSETFAWSSTVSLKYNIHISTIYAKLCMTIYIYIHMVLWIFIYIYIYICISLKASACLTFAFTKVGGW